MRKSKEGNNMLKLILVRHGQSMANIDISFAGKTNSPLSDLGRKQAEVTAEYIIKNYNVVKVYSSDLDRAVITAHYVADKLGLEVTEYPQLEELNAGDWEGRLHKDLVVAYPEEYRLFKNDVAYFHPSGGESMQDLYKRTTTKFNEIIKANKDTKGDVLIVAHGLALRCIMGYIMYRDSMKIQEVPIGSNACISEVDYDFDTDTFNIIKNVYDGHLEGMITRVHLMEIK